MQLKIGVRTSGLSLTWQKPLNNAARVVLQVLGAVLGGVNSIDASGIDEAIGLPSYEARMYITSTPSTSSPTRRTCRWSPIPWAVRTTWSG